jgi:alkylated DNA repair dioxygenase AlkB
MNLFEESFDLKMKDGDVTYYPSFIDEETANSYFKTLLNTIEWQQDTIKVFGKTYLQPRLTAFYATNNHEYKYSNIIMNPKVFCPELLEIKSLIEEKLKISFTSCLANLYRNGQDSNGWHADNEKELGENPIIASVSFGAERVFHFKHRHDKNSKLKIVLGNGSLLVMKGTTQTFWLHQIPKIIKPVENRINLTFRIIK